jgi:hypothetical protein
LTFQQSFLWNYFDLEKGNHPRDMFVFKIVGPLDSDLLATSLNEVVRRHDCLRTRIVNTAGVLEQHVDEHHELGLEVIDLTKHSRDDRELKAVDFIDAFAKRKCSLADGPLMDTVLVRLSVDEHLLAWAIHHVIADGTSIGIVLGQIWSVYANIRQGKQQRLAGAAHYLDYALWQHATHNDWLQRHQGYWEHRMTGAARAQWPSDTCAVHDEPAYAWFDVPGMASLADLRRIARSARTTPAMVVLTLYAGVVANWCGQRVITVPVNIAGRHRPEHEHAAGYYAQFLCVNVEITGNATFLDSLAKVSAEFRGALTHQDFGRVAAQIPHVLLGAQFSWLPWNRSTIGIPPSSVATPSGLSLEHFPFKRPAISPLEFQGIAIVLMETEAQYSASLWCRTDVFSARTVERFASELRNFCERAMRNPNCRLSDRC